MEFGRYMQCAQNVRQNMALLSTRFMDHHEKDRRKHVNEEIGLVLTSRADKLFTIVKHLAFAMPSRNTENELVVDLKTKQKIQEEWSNLRGMKINFQHDDSKINDELKRRILELNNALNGEVAFTLWKENDLFWREQIQTWKNYAKKSDPDLAKIPGYDRSAIQDLAADPRLALEDILYKQCILNNEEERQYATLLLFKYWKQRKMPSNLTQYYKDIAWVLIGAHKKEPVIKKMFDIFDGRDEVIEYLNIYKEELLSDDALLNKVDLYATKYDRLEQMNSLLLLHVVKKGMIDICPVSNCDYESYAEIIGQKDKIFRSVVFSLMHVEIEPKKVFDNK